MNRQNFLSSIALISIFVGIGNPGELFAQLDTQPAPAPSSSLQPRQVPVVPNPPLIAPPDSLDGLAPNIGSSGPADVIDLPSSTGMRRNARSSSDTFARLSRLDSLQRFMPQMFADSPAASLSVVVNDGLMATTDLPLAGGARRMKVAANNRALPQDRIIFQYQCFVNALTVDASRFRVGPASRTIDLNQYTVGFEKTFADGLASVDVRMPFTNQLELATPNFGAVGGQIGNLNAKLKAVLSSDQTYCFSAGTGFEIPTGSSVSFQGNRVQYIVENDAFFLQPFLAYEERVDDWFFNGFASVDVALNGNRFQNAFIGRPVLGRINDQTLGTISAGVGRWICFDPDRCYLNGFALTSELNYTTTLQDSDSVSDVFPAFQSTMVQNVSNRSDHLNLTIGGHLAFGYSSLRFGFVQPLRMGDDRLFDHEFNVQFNRTF